MSRSGLPEGRRDAGVRSGDAPAMLDKPPLDTGDDVLARRAGDGDDAAFEVLVARYEGRVYQLARRLTCSDADAEDALQETFLQVHRGLAAFRGESAFSTWLFRIVTNAALMIRRRRRRRPVEPLDDYLPRFDGSGRHARRGADLALAARADEILDRKRLVKQALIGLDRLPDLYRTAFVLRDLEEMPATEVAALLGVDPATVRQRVHRARLMLRGFLSDLVGAKP